MCGATFAISVADFAVWGLSPRVRGNPVQELPTQLRPRPIPACAGQPEAINDSRAPCWAYPRVCGATLLDGGLRFRRGGLSPRVRGNLDHIAIADRAVGPIPACAGQPNMRVSISRFTRAYPRVCGATSPESTRLRGGWGLSPRVRGNLPYKNKGGVGAGPIPACAGQPWRKW